MKRNAVTTRVVAAAGLLLAVALAATPGSAQRGPQTQTLILPPNDAALQSGLESILRRAPYASLIGAGRLSVSIVDITTPDRIRYAGWDDDRERYAASLPKIGILLGVFSEIEKGRLEYTPQLRTKLELMIRNSNNEISSELIQRIGFRTIEAALRDPRHQLYDENRSGGIWVGRGYGGLGTWRRDPVGNQSHGATTRQTARFLVMLEQGRLVNRWASAEMKDIMGQPAIHHKFVLGLARRPDSQIYRKSGTWERWHADAALVERDGRTYAAVALLEAPANVAGSRVLSQLIVDLDDLIVAQNPQPSATRIAREPVSGAPPPIR